MNNVFITTSKGQISKYIISRSYFLVIYEILAKSNPPVKSYIVFFCFSQNRDFRLRPLFHAAPQLNEVSITLTMGFNNACILIFSPLKNAKDIPSTRRSNILENNKLKKQNFCMNLSLDDYNMIKNGEFIDLPDARCFRSPDLLWKMK